MQRRRVGRHRPNERGATSLETGIIVAFIALIAVAALTSVGNSAGGEDIETANEALGEGTIVEVSPDSDHSTTAGSGAPTAGTGAGGSSGAFGSAAQGVSNSGLSGGITSDLSIGGYWNTHTTGQWLGGEWEVVSGTVDAFKSHDHRYEMNVDGQFIDLNGNNAGHIRRTLTVIPGAHYNLSVDIGENPSCGHGPSPDVKRMQIIWNGQVLSELDVDVPPTTVETYTVKVPPSIGAEATLEFKSMLDGYCGPMIDNPTLTYVPNRADS